MPVLNWAFERSFADIGAEIRLFKPISLNAAFGMYYPGLSPVFADVYSKGYYVDVGLRYYPEDWFRYPVVYFSPLYRYQQRESIEQLNFIHGGLPYSKLTAARRTSQFGWLIAGITPQHHWKDYVAIDIGIGFGVEYRITEFLNLQSFEQDAINTGEVWVTKWDDPDGRLLPAFHFEVKVGFSLF